MLCASSCTSPAGVFDELQLGCADPRTNRGEFTLEEDKTLLRLVKREAAPDWIGIASSLATDRTPIQCFQRYQRSFNVDMYKKAWSREEDARLLSLVRCLGEHNWLELASHMPRRTDGQCYHRWKKSLHPDLDGQLKVRRSALLAP